MSNGKCVTFGSSDRELVETLLECLGRPLRFETTKTRLGAPYYRVQMGDVRFYRWLNEVGLHPRKSLTIGAIAVPQELAAPIARGLFDGDGNIQNFVHAPTPSTYPDYRYERLWVFFNCASRPHLEWLRSLLATTHGLKGYIEKLKPREGRHDFFRLKYGKHESIALLRAMYPNEAVPRLMRKWKIWDDYARRNGLT